MLSPNRKKILSLIAVVTFILITTVLVNAEPPKGMRLYVFFNGTINLEKAFMTDNFTDVGKKIDIPVPFYLVVHPKGPILIDTGMNPEAWPASRKAWMPARQTEDQKILNALKRLGYTPDMIKYLVMTHLHVDHAGGIGSFPKSTIVVQKDEMRAAWWPEPFTSVDYVELGKARQFKYMQLNGDWDLFGDGSIKIIRTIGHTQGHQSVIVTLHNSGTIIIAGDAVSMPEHLEGGLQHNLWAKQEFLESVGRLKAERDRTGGWIIINHCPEFFKTLKLAPDYYD
jgi:N-acyl homoserine lactone hydrolase